MAEYSIPQLREGMLRLRHEDPRAFLELVAEFVTELESFEFRRIAASYSSWPINVPKRRSPKKEKSPPVFTREGKSAAILDNYLKVGSALEIKLDGKKSPDFGLDATRIAIELVQMMAGIRRHPARARVIRLMLSSGDPCRGTSEDLTNVIEEITHLPTLSQTTTNKWIDTAIKLARAKYGVTYKETPFVTSMLNRKASSKTLPKNDLAKVAFFERELRQSIHGQLSIEFSE